MTVLKPAEFVPRRWSGHPAPLLVKWPPETAGISVNFLNQERMCKK